MRKNLLYKMTMIGMVFAFFMSWNVAVLSASPEISFAPNNIVIVESSHNFEEQNNGKLRCKADMKTLSNYEAELVVRLQINDDRWRTVRTWTVNNGTLSAKIDESYTPTVSGDYRMWVEYKAYDSSGKLVESANDYSEVIHV